MSEVGEPKVAIDEGPLRYRTTLALSLCWVLVFAAMVLEEGKLPLTLSEGVHSGTAYKYGSLTTGALEAGQVWRVITATFVHYNLVHLGLNLLAFVQLGLLVESWYGGGAMLMIYVALGGGGNLLARAMRQGLGSEKSLHSFGGSTVVFGLIALTAVIGWRARTRFGDYVRRQMVRLLVINAIIGAILWRYLDNYGHAGGAIIGGLLGLAHRRLAWIALRPSLSRAAGALALAVLGISGLAQAREFARLSAIAARYRAQEQVVEARREDLVRLARIETLYRRIALPHMVLPLRVRAGQPRGRVKILTRSAESQRRDRRALRDALEALGPPAADGPEDLRRWRALTARALLKRPTIAELNEFETLFGPIVMGASRRTVAAQAVLRDLEAQRQPL